MTRDKVSCKLQATHSISDTQHMTLSLYSFGNILFLEGGCFGSGLNCLGFFLLRLLLLLDFSIGGGVGDGVWDVEG